MGVFCGHGLSKVRTPYDSCWVVPTAYSWVNEGNADLNEFQPLLREQGEYGTTVVEGKRVYFFPHGTSLLVAPLVGALSKLLSWTHGFDMQNYLSTHVAGKIEKPLASFWVALTALLLFELLRRELAAKEKQAQLLQVEWQEGAEAVSRRPQWIALSLAFIFAFGTSAWSIASRALWAHTASALFLTLTLAFLTAGRRQRSLVKWAGSAVALAYVMRPTNSLSVLAFSLYVLMVHRREFWRYLACAAPIATAFISYNFAVFGQWLPDYYLPGRIGYHPLFFEALAGNLWSPARGLLLYIPVFQFCLLGAWWQFRGKRWSALETTLACLLFGHWVMISMFEHWWGGHSYGPRLFTDVLVFLVWFLLPVVDRLFREKPKGLMSGFVLMAAIGVGIHAHGANSKGAWRWNSEPVDVDHAPQRLWDWSDAQFQRR